MKAERNRYNKARAGRVVWAFEEMAHFQNCLVYKMDDMIDFQDNMMPALKAMMRRINDRQRYFFWGKIWAEREETVID